MRKIEITEKEFTMALKRAFESGMSWGETYSTWFLPTASQTDEKFDLIRKNLIEAYFEKK